MGKDYDLEEIWNEPDEDIRSLKSLILFGIRGIAAYAYHAMILGYTDDTVNRFMLKALRTISLDFSMEELLPIVMETGEVNLICMELLDRANRETYGNPVPTAVPLSIEPGPFIVVSGHDLHDLALLLEQTKDKGINIYTHGEMLPCHAYPKLKRVSSFKRELWYRMAESAKKNLKISPALFYLQPIVLCLSKKAMQTVSLPPLLLLIRTWCTLGLKRFLLLSLKSIGIGRL